MARLIEHGVQDRHNQRLYGKETPCSGGATFKPASMVDTKPAFQALALGFAGTWIVFIAELCMNNWSTIKKISFRFVHSVDYQINSHR